jgi:hypothetical protein
MNKNLTILAAIAAALSMSNAAMVATGLVMIADSAAMSETCSVRAAKMTSPPISRFALTDAIANTLGSFLIACAALAIPLRWSDSSRFLTGPGAEVVEIPFAGRKPFNASRATVVVAYQCGNHRTRSIFFKSPPLTS